MLVRATIFWPRRSATIETCHRDGVVHRDLKPSNIILRNGEAAYPVVVDFGLSFNNDTAVGDVTRVGEEIGNRFLRLPEHAVGGRDPVSDVTKLAALFLYCITNIEPRVLVDELGEKPHQRPRIVAALSEQLTGQRLLALQALFDRSFDTRLAERFQTVQEFRAALEEVLTMPEVSDDYDGLMQRLAAFASQPGNEETADNVRRLQRARDRIARIVTDLGTLRGLDHPGRDQGTKWAPRPSRSIQIALVRKGARDYSAVRWVMYRIELSGPNEVTVSADGVELRRGADLFGAELKRSVEAFAARAFLEHEGLL